MPFISSIWGIFWRREKILGFCRELSLLVLSRCRKCLVLLMILIFWPFLFTWIWWLWDSNTEKISLIVRKSIRMCWNCSWDTILNWLRINSTLWIQKMRIMRSKKRSKKKKSKKTRFWTFWREKVWKSKNI